MTMLRTTKKRLLISTALVAVAVPAIVIAQLGVKNPKPDVNAPVEHGTMFFQTNVGSFKILGSGERKAEGTVSFDFNGTVLVSGLDGEPQMTGTVRREMDVKDLKKKVYFGKGHMVIRGKFSNIQFFGRDLKARWDGWGVIRLYGEFDKDLNTGDYWYPEENIKRPWNTGGITQVNPKAKVPGQTTKPRVVDTKAGV